MLTHVFGASCSQYCSAFALRKTATDNKGSFDEKVVETVVRDFYVDDWLKSVPEVNVAIELINQVREMLKGGGFHLTKFISNSNDVLDKTPSELRARQPSELQLDQSNVERTLGVAWNLSEDAFTFKFSKREAPLTKRGILQILSSVFDPLGFLTPFTLTAKIIIQSLWRQECGWDDPLPQEDADAWLKWMEDLQRIGDYLISRCYITHPLLKVCRREVHIFCDASEKAFGAVAYMRITYSTGEVTCCLIMSKSRLAPLKFLTIVRLELQAAVLAVRLKHFILSEIDVPIDEVYFWTDSIITLQYIKNDTCRFKVFVMNRVTEIREHSEVHQWRHVPGSRNPADDLTRGLKIEEMGENSRWNKGPAFLYQDPSCWPQCKANSTVNITDPEIKQVSVVALDDNVIEEMENYSSWEKLVRTYAWVLRFMNNTKKGRDSHNDKFLTVEELRKAMAVIMKLIQWKFFERELKLLKSEKPLPSGSPLLQLKPFIDESDGLMRVGGRLCNALISYASMHPIILPSNSKLVKGMVVSEHKMKADCGPEYLLAHIQQRYWIIGARKLVKGVVRNCFECKRRNKKTAIPIMADLPKFRVDSGNPVFYNTGVDFFGPLRTKIGRGNQKRWGCIFTCLATRAIHLELSESLETDSFINTLERFVNRRGHPFQIISDCGTNFKGADKELSLCLQELKQERIGTYAARKNIQWRFNPPDAPHMGGAWERMVQAVKQPLKCILKNSLLTDVQLETVFSEVECIVNSRPLTAVSDDINDLEALTPNHFLLGRANPNLAPGIFDIKDESSRKRWRRVQVMTEQFWKRWRQEYLPMLSVRQKWNKEMRNMRSGDLVLIMEKDSPREKWKLGRVTAILPGKDGRVRVAKVKTPTGEIVRPVAKLCLLEESNE